MIISLVDFSFIRSLVAQRYSVISPPCYDPVSLFLIDLFRYMDGYQHSSQILSIIHDEERGRAYRAYAGISMKHLPCEGTLSNFRARIGENLYNEIFHVLVGIFHKLEMITFKVLAHDGTLFPTWARYKGCTYFCEQCCAITVEDVLDRVRNRVLYRLNRQSENPLGSECRVYSECPSTRFPEEVQKPKIELFAFKLAFSDAEPTLEERNTAILFGVKDELDRENLSIKTLRSNVIGLDVDSGSITIACPKLPKDRDAKIGVRRNPQNADKKEKIFGYNAVLSTSVELELKIELPVALSTIAGNGEEADKLIANRDQLEKYHSCRPVIDIADAKYDTTPNYEYIRGKGSIPIIDYNPRNENLSKEART
jgi:hypothetical protein